MLTAKLQSQLDKLYGPASISAPSKVWAAPVRPAHIEDSHETNDAQEDDHGFEFRLFSSTKEKGEDEVQIHKIEIKDEDADWGDGAFIVPRRDLTYYIAPKAQGDWRHGFELMAMSGEDVLREKSRRHWGLEVPWRVKVLKSQGKVKKVGIENIVTINKDAEELAKKKKPGKKRRIVLRERKKAFEEAEQRRKLVNEKKEEAEKEKRIRRNREKKIKRRLKEKAEKAKKADTGGTNISCDGDTQMDVSMDGMDAVSGTED